MTHCTHGTCQYGGFVSLLAYPHLMVVALGCPDPPEVHRHCITDRLMA